MLGGTLCVRDEKTKMRPGCCCSSRGEGSREGSRPRGKKKDVSNYVKVGRKNLLISSEKSVFFLFPPCRFSGLKRTTQENIRTCVMTVAELTS